MHRLVAFSTYSLVLVSALTIQPETASAVEIWQYGGFVDIAYLHSFNMPDNHEWRSKQTSAVTNEVVPNLALVYLRKDSATDSRWGIEMAFQAGRDTDRLVPTPQPGGSRPIEGADILRHIARANVSYLMPVGHGVSVIAGLIKGTKSYEEFYAKYNVNYTRTYVTDNNPNFLFGAGASYPFYEVIVGGDLWGQ